MPRKPVKQVGNQENAKAHSTITKNLSKPREVFLND